MKRKTLYVTDLDGTLRGTESAVSERSAIMLNELVDAGVMITPATARTPATVQPLMSAVRQSSYIGADGQRCPLPAIVMTGAGLWNRDAVRFESCKLIPETEAVCIRDTFMQNELHPFVYCLNGDSFLNVYHPLGLTQNEERFYLERKHLSLKRFHFGEQPSRWDRVALFFATGSVEAVKRACCALHEATRCSVAWYPDIIVPDTGLIDLYAPGVSKAEAVKSLAAATGADEVVVFGDNLNDLPMMRVADVAVAVGNALPQVQDEAHVVIGTNADDSVARFIMDREKR